MLNLRLTLATVFGWIFAVTASANSTPPNLIVIMADDLGYADVGFNGCKDIPTPNIDSIAAKGVRFLAMCPSRCAGRAGLRS